MSIYVSIVLLSALTVFDDNHPPDQGEVFALEFGTTLGLVLAHAFASWLSTSIVGAGRVLRVAGARGGCDCRGGQGAALPLASRATHRSSIGHCDAHRADAIA